MSPTASYVELGPQLVVETLGGEASLEEVGHKSQAFECCSWSP
jgi:hypothetical protein